LLKAEGNLVLHQVLLFTCQPGTHSLKVLLLITGLEQDCGSSWRPPDSLPSTDAVVAAPVETGQGSRKYFLVQQGTPKNLAQEVCWEACSLLCGVLGIA
jgi:hypothetical protein